MSETLTQVPPTSSLPQGAGADPYLEALDCLQKAGVPFALLRDEPPSFELLRDLDVLIDPQELEIAAAALERAGFLLKRTPELQKKWVFLRYDSGRFYVLDLHGALVQRNLEYMDGRLALGRRDQGGPYPRLCAEDRYLHLALHNLLGKPALQDKHAAKLRELRRRRLDRVRLDNQTGALGLEAFADRLMDIDSLDSRSWSVLRAQVRRTLRQHPRNRGWWRSKGHWWKRRPVVLALLGPDGSGKTTLLHELLAFLEGSPLAASSAYMGAWGHDQLRVRLVRRLVPPRISHSRIYAAVCGKPVQLTAEEEQFIAKHKPSKRGQALRAFRNAVKEVLFYTGLTVELGYRYLRFVRFSRRPIVVTDRWVYDLELRQGRTPFTYGHRLRRFIYGLFPTPDGTLYLSAPYAVVAARKPQLEREQYEHIDWHWKRFLNQYDPLELSTTTPSAELARSFIDRYWEALLDRYNKHC